MNTRAALFLASALFAANALADVAVVDPWVRAAPPNASVLAGYMTLTNTGTEPVAVVEASSSQFDRVEMHRTEIDDKGMARMFQVKEHKLDPGVSVEFKPGGNHFMLIKPKKPLKIGDHVMIDLKLSDGSVTQIHAIVRAADAAPAAGDGHHHKH